MLLISLVLLLPSCSVEDDHAPLSITPIYMDNPTAKLTVDLIYVVPNEDYDKTMYNVDETKYFELLNGCFFNRYDIGIIKGESKTLINEELYDLRDDHYNEIEVFRQESENEYNPNRLKVFIIPRSNIYAIKGMGLPKRVLIADEDLMTTTSPHEIGHSLGLFHNVKQGNIMSRSNPHLRKEFDDFQVDKMLGKILDMHH